MMINTVYAVNNQRVRDLRMVRLFGVYAAARVMHYRGEPIEYALQVVRMAAILAKANSKVSG